jgi:hypothetical protein
MAVNIWPAKDNGTVPRVFDQQMNMVGCHHAVQYGETDLPLCFEDPMQIPATITGHLLILNL